MTTDQRLPAFGRWLLRLCPLGTRRPEVEADLSELFAVRLHTRGLAYARRRYFRDVASLLCRMRSSRAEHTGDEGATVLESLIHDIRYSHPTAQDADVRLRRRLPTTQTR